MQAQQSSAVAYTKDQGLVELDLESLALVGGGTPKGTWSESDVLSIAAAVDTAPTPKGTW